ncbi:hypothetical protein GCM10010121_069160 [Streptomyces brasiliensis]|uniref:Uncharacterized protein n=1 Tax=Streptomyces brasiliensis TaxID=1954 RepID=A0A917L6R5_9ACTN|nr:hypothetical protein GCM10010121_069160 [Streptomyces brasiliensis]
MALAGAKLFVEEGAHVFISGRRKEALDEAVKLIGRNVTGVQGDSASLDDLDRLFDTVKQEKGGCVLRSGVRVRPDPGVCSRVGVRPAQTNGHRLIFQDDQVFEGDQRDDRT